MDAKKQIALSKFLSRHLRHTPEDLGLTLRPGGWVSVDELLAACARAGKPLLRGDLEEIVRGSDKQRFAFDESGESIRANQGHSVDVDLQLEPAQPPPVLYHGTGSRNRDAISKDGLKKMARHHVHLSPDVATAQKVGQRHGKPIVFVIDTVAMLANGHVFYCSANGVWLTDAVPHEFLRLHD